MLLRSGLLAGVMVLAAAGLGSAATVADLEFNDLIWGDPVDMEGLQDRTVLVYFWAGD